MRFDDNKVRTSLINNTIKKSPRKKVSGISGLTEQSVFGRSGRTCDGRMDREGKGRTCEPGPHYIPISIYCKGRTVH